MPKSWRWPLAVAEMEDTGDPKTQPPIPPGLWHPVDAFFESMSGFATAGASVITNIEATPRNILFCRALTQWIGGMGIIVLSVAVLPLLGGSGMQLYEAEAPGPTTDRKGRRGERGVWARRHGPGKYAFNTYAGSIAMVPTTNFAPLDHGQE